MQILQFKRYFLTEKEREIYENSLLQKIPELNDRIFKLDDKELKELLEKVECKH